MCRPLRQLRFYWGGVLAKLGTYGIFRFGLGLFPEAWSLISPFLAVWAAASVMYGAITAIAQKDIKRMVAYSSIGHMGYVMLGGAAFTELSIVGAILSNGFSRLNFGAVVSSRGRGRNQGRNPAARSAQWPNESFARAADDECFAGAQWHGECGHSWPGGIYY